MRFSKFNILMMAVSILGTVATAIADGKREQRLDELAYVADAKINELKAVTTENTEEES